METRRQTINFLGFLRSQLSGLQGIPTLCYELIQNADDVKDENDQPGGASRISFDVCDDALWVENDGFFREIDFERMEQISWGNKRDEAETTGSFGIGFISVYQITDFPELFSSGQHWQFQPQAREDERILIRKVETENTRFRLPWAFNVSKTRQELGIPPVKPDQLDYFTDQMIQSIENAALFLKQIRVLEVKRNGELLRRIEVLKDGNVLLLDDGENLIQWMVIRGRFAENSKEIRQKYGDLIEGKRKAEVELAIPDRPWHNGLLYAFLPSETQTGLPFHINADFYPSSDRKRILFDQDYKSDWNRLALDCAARTLSEHVNDLLQVFSHQEFWEFTDKVKKTSEKSDPNIPLDRFYIQLKPKISISRTVLTTADNYICPPDSNYLDYESEVAAASIFEELGINTIHPELRKYRSVLLDTGVQLLGISKVVKAFLNKGYTKRFSLAEMPSSLQKEEDWIVLWRAFDNLWERASQSEKNQSEPVLKGLTIAFGSDKALWPINKLFSADDITCNLFNKISNLIWFSKVGDSDKFPGSLVPVFALQDALNTIQDSQDRMEELWKAKKFSPREMYEWLENHPETNYLQENHRELLRSLSIWPTADGKLKPLEDLFLPGNFEDPLNLAQFIDIKALGGVREFLMRRLNVKQLDFLTYIREWIPSVISSQTLSVAQRIRLLDMMSLNIGQMRSDHNLRNLLSNLELVWCGGNLFFPASSTYIETPIIREVLGNKVRFAKISKKNEEGIRDLYLWLGVAENPRHSDVITRIQEITGNPPTTSSIRSINLIYHYLANQWDRWDEREKSKFQSLKNITWLPGTTQKDKWFGPSEVYTVFQDYLFLSQGNFLNIERKIQEKNRDFNRFLGINVTPSCEQVVRHLLFCAAKNIPVNKEVYTNLSRNKDEPSINMLIGKRCLYLQDESGEEKYFLPSHVFWESHSFGNYRFRLGPEFGPYKELFGKLGVKDKPTYEDAVNVLQEISASNHAKSSLKINDESSLKQVIIAAWRLISDALVAEEVEAKEIKRSLGKLKTIPNSQNLLYPPEWLYIEDRPEWGKSFQLLKNNMIEKIEGAWPAMEAAGVRRLSKAIKTELHQCDNPRDDLELQNRFFDRRDLIMRVIEAHRQNNNRDFNLDCLEKLSFSKADEIVIIRSFHGFNNSEAYAFTVDSVFLDETIYFNDTNENYPWISLARELAYALHDSGELSSLGMELKEILSPNTTEQASKNLDEFGYPRVVRVLEKEIDNPTINHLGGQDLGGNERDEGLVDDELDDDNGEVQDPRNLDDDDRGKKRKKNKQKPERNPSRLISYVYPENTSRDNVSSKGVSDRRKKIGQLGVDIVVDFERSEGRDAMDMETIQVNHEGFDVKSIDPNNPSDVRYIEVKATSGKWDSKNPAQMHKSQFELSQEYGAKYWLYIVELVESDRPVMYCVQNPANQVDAFMFDYGWRPLAKTIELTTNPISNTNITENQSKDVVRE